jgi:hypothetical protein
VAARTGKIDPKCDIANGVGRRPTTGAQRPHFPNFSSACKGHWRQLTQLMMDGIL